MTSLLLVLVLLLGGCEGGFTAGGCIGGAQGPLVQLAPLPPGIVSFEVPAGRRVAVCLW